MAHHRERPAEGEAQQPAEPVEVGTDVWADFRGTGLFFHGVVVERREDEHRVIYAHGASEWLGAEGLRPDALREESRVHVRPELDRDFVEGVVARRLGSAVYVRFPNGDERWTALPQIRFRRDAEGAPRRGDEPYTNGAEGTEPGAMVLVNYRSQGLLFAGVVTAVGDGGRLHVVYLDGEQEWVDPALVTPETLAEPARVHVRRRWEPPVWVRGNVHRRVGYAFRVELDDGGMAWTSLFRVRAPVAPPASAAPAPDDAEPAPEGGD